MTGVLAGQRALVIGAATGVIFEYCDENLENPWSYSIEDFVKD